MRCLKHNICKTTTANHNQLITANTLKTNNNLQCFFVVDENFRRFLSILNGFIQF